MATAHFKYTVSRPEADRGDKAGDGEGFNSEIRMDMRFPLDSSTTRYHQIANLTIAEIRLFLGSASAAYIQLYEWCNEPSSRPEDGVMSVTEEADWDDARVFLTSYPNTMISGIKLNTPE